MLSNRHISRTAVLCVVACALLGATLSGTAVAQPTAPQARYYASFGQDAPPIDKVDAAAAQGRYYASFRHSEPLTPPRTQSGETGWVLPLIGLAIVLLIAAAVTIEVRRLGVRRRASRVSTSV
jgi:hypothetical protein